MVILVDILRIYFLALNARFLIHMLLIRNFTFLNQIIPQCAQCTCWSFFKGVCDKSSTIFSDIEIMPWNCHSFSDQLSTTICCKPYKGMRNQEGGLQTANILQKPNYLSQIFEVAFLTTFRWFFNFWVEI